MALPFDGKSVEVEGDGTLILKGILATCDVDRQGEKFDESSLRSAFQRYYERSPLVVLNHKLSQGIGKLIDATSTSAVKSKSKRRFTNRPLAIRPRALTT